MKISGFLRKPELYKRCSLLHTSHTQTHILLFEKKLHCALTRLRRSAMHTKARTVLGSRTKDHEETKHSSYAYKGRPEFTIFMPFCMGSKGQHSIQNAVHYAVL